MDFKIGNIIVRFVGISDATEEEAKKYVDYVYEHKESEEPITSITVTACDDGMVDVEYLLRGKRFERIRRITGYLTGSLENWNDSKQAEERDRVKHGRFD